MIRTVLGLLPREARGRTVRYAVLALVSVVLRAASCLLLIPLLQELFGDSPSDALPWVGVLTVVTVAAWINDTVLARVGGAIGFDLLARTQHDVSDRLARVPLGWFTAAHTSRARQAIASGGPELVGIFAYLLTPLTGAVLLPVALAIGLFFFSWQLALAAALAVPLLLVALWAGNRVARGADEADARANAELTEGIVEFARTQAALRASRRVDPAASRTGQAVTRQRATTVRLLLFQVPGQLLFSIASQVALILLAGTIALLAVDGRLGAAETVALLIVLVRFLEPFNALADLAPGLERTRGVLDNIRTVLDAPVDRLGEASATDQGRVEPDGPTAPDRAVEAAAAEAASLPVVEFRDVWFGYGQESDDVLRGVSFTLAPGSTTALVGPSGSGKSTILALLAGLQTPDRGQVLVGGADQRDLGQDARRALSSMVFQHPYLFDGPIRDNVLAGRPAATEDELRRVMTLAQVDEITARLPDGERSRVGEAGTALSGGERQRVSIARALLKPAPLLLVDEATSALDTENEAAVAQALSADPTPRTRVVVAHRLDSIRAADRVLFLDDGQVVEEGTIAELTARGGRFARFWREQEASSGWRLATVGP